MTKTIKYLIITLLLLPLFSFSQKVENVHFEQEGKQVYIYYDLHGTDTYNVTIYCSEDNGNTWGIPLKQVSGDVGKGIKPGNNKKVVWDVLKDKTKLTGSIKFKIQIQNFILIDPRDGQSYKTVKIGRQIWMAENLNYKFSTSWCKHKKNTDCKKYGRLYTWYAAKGACPYGWHLPSDEEWKALERHLGISQSDIEKQGWRGMVEAAKMKSKILWRKNGNGTNSSNFNALPGGYCNNSGVYYGFGFNGRWWSSTESLGVNAWGRELDYLSGQVRRNDYNKMIGFSIRCLKN